MNPLFRTMRQLTLPAMLMSGLAASFALAVLSGSAQTTEHSGPPIRITGALSSAGRARLKGTLLPQAVPANDTGSVPTGTKLHGISMVFSRSAVQKADLLTLLKAQQDHASPLYHQWLTPDQFAERFGIAQADLDKASYWLQEQGFTIDRISRSHDRIFFSGSVAQVNVTFGTELHFYTVAGEKKFAPSTELSVPSALAGLVLNIGNLSSFKLKGMHHVVKPKSDFTSGISGSHFVSPGDVSTIYDVKAAYQAGWTGNGQSIAIVGQSDIEISDIEHFQTASGWAAPKDPFKVLVPNTGNAGAETQGDQGESDLDLEWSSTMAPDANIFFVYTGDGGNAGVFDSVAYAVEMRISPIITVSYGTCELATGGEAGVQSIEDVAQQGAAQGQSLLAASGDAGASTCFPFTTLSIADRTSLAVSYPASSPWFTGVGGTQFNEGSGSYWNSTPGTDIISSALSYVPELVWNEDSTRGLGSSGGGASIYFSKPDWQVGVPGIPSDGHRDVPDVALDSASEHDGLLFCTSDSYFWQPNQVASCDKGFRDAATNSVNTAGGTSFASPIFAGMLALLNQQQNSTGLGLINPKLYTVAANPATYASAFHDVTGGDNRCDVSDPNLCPNGTTGFTATPGYDQATGLGTIDFNNLMTAWGTPSLIGTTTTLNLLTTNPSTSAPVSLSIAVAPATGSGSPSGTMTMTIDGTADPVPVNLAAGVANYDATIIGSGIHILVATYSGDSVFAASTSTLTVSTLNESSVLIIANPQTPLVGSATTFTFAVEPKVSLNHPTGTLFATIDGVFLDPFAVAAEAILSHTTVFAKPGKHIITASYTGSASFAASSSSLTVNAVTATTLNVVAVSGTPAVGASDTLIVKVLPVSGIAIPAGPLRVLVNGTVLLPAPVLDASGTVSFPLVFTSVGAQTVDVTYPGSDAFGSATGGVSFQVIAAAIPTTTLVSPASASPVLNATDIFTINIAPTSGSTLPNGTVNVTVDGKVSTNPLFLTNGAATYMATFTTVGAHTVSATYLGDSGFVRSTGYATVTVLPPSFTLTASDLTVQSGSNGTSTITVTPTNGYKGVIGFSITNSGLTNACFSAGTATISSGPATTTLNLSTNKQACPATAAGNASLSKPISPGSLKGSLRGLATIVAALLIGAFSGRRRLRQGLFSLVALVGMGMFLGGCAGDSSLETKAGSYTLIVTGTDTVTQTIVSTVSVKVTVQ